MSKLDDIAKLVAFAEDVLALAREGGLTAARRGRPPKGEARRPRKARTRRPRTNGAATGADTFDNTVE